MVHKSLENTYFIMLTKNPWKVHFNKFNKIKRKKETKVFLKIQVDILHYTLMSLPIYSTFIVRLSLQILEKWRHTVLNFSFFSSWKNRLKIFGLPLITLSKNLLEKSKLEKTFLKSFFKLLIDLWNIS